MITVKDEIWADKDGNPVPFGDARGVTVLHGAGVDITEEQAKKAGLVKAAKPKPEPEPPAEEAEPEPESKSVDESPADKAVKGPDKTK